MRGIRTKESGKWKKAALTLALLLVLAVLLNSARGVYQKKKEAQQTLARMEKEKSELENRQKYLQDSLANLATKEGIDFEIRSKLNVAAAGERVAIIVNQTASSSDQTSSLSAWQKIKNFFTDLFK